MFEKVKRLFTPAKSMDAQEAQSFMESHKEGTYTLLDVRQPKEYEQSHIPGSVLIPLGELSDSYERLDRKKPIIVHCAIGGRSRVAAQMLLGEGFEEVYNLSGGIYAWHGGVAEGPVGLNLDMVRGDEPPVEITKLAYGMEKSLGKFYQTIQERTQDKEVMDLARALASVEEKHKSFLLELYRDLDPSGPSDQEFDAEVTSTVLEGGFERDELMRKNKHCLDSVLSLLDLAMMLEAQALDLYLRFSKRAENEQTREILHRISDEEKEHIRSLGRLLEKRA